MTTSKPPRPSLKGWKQPQVGTCETSNHETPHPIALRPTFSECIKSCAHLFSLRLFSSHSGCRCSSYQFKEDLWKNTLFVTKSDLMVHTQTMITMVNVLLLSSMYLPPSLIFSSLVDHVNNITHLNSYLIRVKSFIGNFHCSFLSDVSGDN